MYITDELYVHDKKHLQVAFTAYSCSSGRRCLDNFCTLNLLQLA